VASLEIQSIYNGENCTLMKAYAGSLLAREIFVSEASSERRWREMTYVKEGEENEIRMSARLKCLISINRLKAESCENNGESLSEA